MKGHVLADGSESRGYLKLEVELLDAPISGEALRLLLRIRRRCDQDETDGVINERSLRALAAYYELRPTRIRALLGELEAVSLLVRAPKGWKDVNFVSWMRSRAERSETRSAWRRWQENHRTRIQDPPVSGPDQTPESGPESGHSRAPSLSLSLAPSPSPPSAPDAASGIDGSGANGSRDPDERDERDEATVANGRQKLQQATAKLAGKMGRDLSQGVAE